MAKDQPSFATEYELMIISAGTRARRQSSRSRAAELVELADWRQLSDLLSAGRLLPTLGPRLVELAGGRADQEFETAVAAAVAASQHQDALLLLVCEQLRNGLAAAGIRSRELKGPRLGQELHGEAGRRLSSDIDLLLAPEQLGSAVEVARSLGYAAPTDHVEPHGLPLLHFTLEHGEGKLPPVELHWRVHWYESRFAVERLLPPSAGGGEWRPEPVDELAALLLFYARDGFTGLRQATDVSAWWDRYGAELEPADLAELITAYPALARSLSVAARVAARVVGIPAALASAGIELDSRGRVALRLATPWPYASSQQLYAEIGLIDGLLAPPGGFSAFFRRQVAPPREVIREHAEHAESESVNTTLGYGARVLGRYALAFARLLRSRGSAARL